MINVDFSKVEVIEDYKTYQSKLIESCKEYLSDFSTASKQSSDIKPPARNVDCKYHEDVVRVCMKHAQKDYNFFAMEGIFRTLGDDWYKNNNDLRFEVIDFLLSRMQDEIIGNIDFVYEGQKNNLIKDVRRGYDYTDQPRWAIGFSLNSIIKPKLKSFKSRYQETLKAALYNKKLKSGRLGLVVPYAIMSKEDSREDLLNFLSDRDILQETLLAIKKLKVKEAIPHVKELIENPNSSVYVVEGDYVFFKDIAKTTLKALEK